MPTPEPSTRELLAELAGIEDAIRLLPTYEIGPDGRPVMSQQLLALFDREAEVTSALRSRPTALPRG